ncbi:MAG: hypothetical protein WEA56_13775 [Balneolaceae bacterium]
MERLVRLLTQQYVKLLPPDQEFYTPQDLYDLNIPDFLVERVVLEMNINLSDSIIPPHSEWADMAADSVQDAWQQFLDAIAEEHRMPAAFAASVFETAITDILELALQPREAIPEAIFGKDEQLDIDDLRERIHNVTIHRHMASAVVRYMERKQKAQLSLTECKILIEKIDEKVIEKYNPLNWAQILSPVFILAGPSVDADLFRIFFEDKGRTRTARKFDHLNEPVDKSGFIEVLSSPETDLDDESNLFDVSAAETGSSAGSLISKFTEHSEDEAEESEAQNQLSADEDSEDEEDNDTIIGTFNRHRSPESEQQTEEDEQEAEEEEGDDDPSLYSRFIFDTEAVDEEDEVPDEGETTLYKELKLKQDLRHHDDREEAGFILQSRNKEEPENGSSKQNQVSQNIDDILSGVDKFGPFDDSAKDAPESDDEPIWQAFLEEQAGKIEDMNPESMEDVDPGNMEDVDPGNMEDVGPENIDEEGFIDEPIIDLTQEAQSSEEKIKALAGWLEDDEKRFTAGIFGDSQSAYEEALESIYDFDDWKSASRYIEKEIFARNFVDVYDEVAVDFTDRLHTFFMEFKSSKMNG